MGDMQRLQRGIEKGLRTGVPTKIAVHQITQVEEGKGYAQRVAVQVGGDPNKLNFVFVPFEQRVIIPPGTILSC
jgi:hypothetical protein